MHDYTDVRRAGGCAMVLGTEQTAWRGGVTLGQFKHTGNDSMTTDPGSISASNTGDEAAHLSDTQAKAIVRETGEIELDGFVRALGMQRPVAAAKAAQLLEHVIKATMSATVAWFEGQMREDHWDQYLSDGETMTMIAERAQAYLESEEGIRLFNVFTKTFAKTTGEMFD